MLRIAMCEDRKDESDRLASLLADYQFAIKDKDGNYYKQDGTPNSPATTPVYVTGNSTDIVFDNLPMDKDYEIVKLPSIGFCNPC